MRLGFVKNTGVSAFLVAMLVVAPQVWAETFTAKVVGVSDGDTVKVLTEQSCDSGKDCRSGKSIGSIKHLFTPKLKYHTRNCCSFLLPKPQNLASQRLKQVVFWSI